MTRALRFAALVTTLSSLSVSAAPIVYTCDQSKGDSIFKEFRQIVLQIAPKVITVYGARGENGYIDEKWTYRTNALLENGWARGERQIGNAQSATNVLLGGSIHLFDENGVMHAVVSGVNAAARGSQLAELVCLRRQ